MKLPAWIYRKERGRRVFFYSWDKPVWRHVIFGIPVFETSRKRERSVSRCVSGGDE